MLYLTYSVEILPGCLLSWLVETFNVLRILSRVMRGSAMKQATIASFQILTFSLFILIYHLFPLYALIVHLTVMELQIRLSYPVTEEWRIQLNTLRTGLLNCLNARSRGLTFRHRAFCIQGQAFRYSPENAFYIFNQQIYFIIWYLLDRASSI